MIVLSKYHSSDKPPRVLIVSGKEFCHCANGYFSYGGTIKEYNALGALFDLCILNPVVKYDTPPTGWEQLDDSIVVENMGKISFFHNLPAVSAMWKSFRRTAEVCRTWKPDVVICKGPREDGFAAIFAARYRGDYPVILHYSFNWMPPGKPFSKGILRNLIYRCYLASIYFYKKKFLRLAGRAAHRIACVSEDFRRQLSNVCGVPENEIVLLQTFFTLTEEYFQIPEPDIEAGTLQLAYIGRLDKNKNVNTLLEALALLLNEGIVIRLVIVGDGPEKRNLEEKSIQLGFTENIRFLGRLPNSGISDILKDCLALVLPSFSEGLPKVILEAFAAGRCVLGSNGEGIARLVKDGQTGYLFDPSSPGELATCIRKLIANPGHAVQMGKQARKAAKAFKPSSAAENWEKIIHKIIES